MADQAIGSDQGPEAEEICSNCTTCTTGAFTGAGTGHNRLSAQRDGALETACEHTRSIIGKKVTFSRPVLSKAGSKEKSWLSRAGRRVTGIYGKRAMALSRLL